ncbi:SGNH/GDSL hydrolase family protein [bacterium]|nr:SGNH/GDSL hydrolase family protein [candidate division CSSED10-310 bacterium]
MNGRVILSVILAALVGAIPSPEAAFNDPPALFLPENDARIGADADAMVFSWEDTGIETYQIEFGVDDQFAVSSGPIESPDPYYDLFDLIPADIWRTLNIVLYWRVREVHILGIPGEWSLPFRLFKTDLTPPGLLQPPSDARFSHDTALPRFEWSPIPGAETYEVEFATDEKFEESIAVVRLLDPFLDFAGADRTSWDPLEGIFFWRVSADRTEELPGPWSAGRYFSKTILPAPELFWPADRTRFPPDSLPPFLEWLPGEACDHYQLRFALDRDCTRVAGILECRDTRFCFDDYLTDHEWRMAYANLFWSVASVDASNRPGPWSPAWELTKNGLHRITALGDSITWGECVENGYLDMLTERLLPRWGEVSWVNASVGGTKSAWGEAVIGDVLIDTCPQFVLILFGANDSVDPGNCDPPYECNVEGHLEAMVQTARNRGVTPVISTVLPVNPEGSRAYAQWRVDMYNDAIREMADRIDAPLVDLNQMFWSFGDDLPMLFCDWGHPSREGYEVMAEGYYQGIISHGG